jgi:hypothetical protein
MSAIRRTRCVGELGDAFSTLSWREFNVVCE